MQYKRSGSKPFLFNKDIVFTYGKECLLFYFIFLWRDKNPIHIYSFLKVIPLLAPFLIKAKTSFKYSWYLPALLLIKKASLTVHLSFKPPYQLTFLFVIFCNVTKFYLGEAQYCLWLMTYYFYSISELSFLIIRSSL